ncbi:MAG: DUF4198 domain-containing protein [Chromatiales bacterium]|nr:DUF4198 domain-containing protein [Chromatiales bacterium]
MAAFALAVLAGCAAKPLDFELEIKVLLDGRPVKGATVTVDGAAEGSTDGEGMFVKTLNRVPEKAIALVVQQQDSKLRTRAWEKQITIKKRKDGEPVERQALIAELQRFVILAVTEGGQPAAGARVSVDGKEAGTTTASGELEYAFGAWPRNGLRLSATKEGFGDTAFAYKGESGDRIAMPLYKEAVVSVEALEERYGRTRALAGVAVSIAGRRGRRHRAERRLRLPAQRDLRRDRAAAHQFRRAHAGGLHPQSRARRPAAGPAVLLPGRRREAAHRGDGAGGQHRRRGHQRRGEEDRVGFHRRTVRWQDLPAGTDPDRARTDQALQAQHREDQDQQLARLRSRPGGRRGGVRQRQPR